nr:PREDICTED: uncharacterized protein LOC109033064 [Bemisia tabaci]
MLNPCLAKQIYEAIYHLIPEEERLKELFLGWTVLDAEEKEMIDDLIIQSDKLQFYKPLMDALRQWELVQDTQGAPGCRRGLVSFPCDPQVKKELTRVIFTLENILEKIHQENRAVVSSENVCCSSSVANDSDIMIPERTQSDGVIVEEIHHQLISCHNRVMLRSFSLDGLCSYKR